jgi:hypothetical protein
MLDVKTIRDFVELSKEDNAVEVGIVQKKGSCAIPYPRRPVRSNAHGTNGM